MYVKTVLYTEGTICCPSCNLFLFKGERERRGGGGGGEGGGGGRRRGEGKGGRGQNRNFCLSEAKDRPITILEGKYYCKSYLKILHANTNGGSAHPNTRQIFIIKKNIQMWSSSRQTCLFIFSTVLFHFLP
jgi:hypothetical protein